MPVFGVADVLIVFAAMGLCLPESAFRIICAPDPQPNQTRYWPLDQDRTATGGSSSR